MLSKHQGFEEIRDMEPSYEEDYEFEEREEHERAMREQDLVSSVKYFKEKGEPHRVLLILAQMLAPEGVEISVFMTDPRKISQ